MIADLQWTEQQVNWQYNNKKIEIGIEAVFFATIVKDGNLICIQSGKNYIEEKIYFYNYDGEFVLSYDLDEVHLPLPLIACLGNLLKRNHIKIIT